VACVRNRSYGLECQCIIDLELWAFGRSPSIVVSMAMTDPERVAANKLLAARMAAWAEFEDRYVRRTDDVVARELPELLELGEAFPAGEREPLRFPPIGGGPSRLAR